MTPQEARDHALDVLRQHEAARELHDRKIERYHQEVEALMDKVYDLERERDEAAAAGADAVVRAVRAEVERDELKKRVEALETATRSMLDLEARRMYEHDCELHGPVPCPCPGCVGLREALKGGA